MILAGSYYCSCASYLAELLKVSLCDQALNIPLANIELRILGKVDGTEL